MTASVLFSKLLQDAQRQGIAVNQTRKSIDWLRERARDVKSVQTKKLFEDKSRLVNSVEPGSLYLFKYDPKLKDVLPYYDRFPLVFPFASTEDGFMGLNMHYLPHILRARLMDGLYEYTSNEKMDKTTKLKISYDLLKSVSKLEYFRPCIKRYLGNHVTSRFIYITPKEWELALFLPLERFEKASTSRVWADSRRKI